MKLFGAAVIVYVIQFFLLPFGVEFLQAQLGLAAAFSDPKMAIIVFSILPTTLLVAIGALLYALWARVALDFGGCIGVFLVFIAVPGMAYLLVLGTAFYVNPALAVEDLQGTIIPLFDSFQSGDIYALFDRALMQIPFIAPFLLGPCLVSFFTRSHAVAEARIIL